MNFAAKSKSPANPALHMEPSPTVAYLGLGGNVGNPRAAIDVALTNLADNPNIAVRGISSLYQTAPIGLTAQPDFVNAVASIETRLSPEDLLSTTLHLENLLGRVRTERWAPRVIDIDVLLYGDRVISTDCITVPHPRMHERAFVLVPLAELAPDLRIPGFPDQTVAEMASKLVPETRITKIVGDGVQNVGT
jgi:2-amino-4-hydroxy-6-hydroxymethyldihydropteridine diphosphokinase